MAPKVPEYRQYMNPILDALRALGGSATIEELNSHVASAMKLTDDQLAVLHDPERRGGQTEIAYRMAWARTYLKAAGLLTNSERGVWSLTPEGSRAGHVDEKALTRQCSPSVAAEPIARSPRRRRRRAAGKAR